MQRRKDSLKHTLRDSQIRSMLDAIGKLTISILIYKLVITKPNSSYKMYWAGILALVDSNSERFEKPVIQPAILTLNPKTEILSILLDHININQMLPFYGKNFIQNPFLLSLLM